MLAVAKMLNRLLVVTVVTAVCADNCKYIDEVAIRFLILYFPHQWWHQSKKLLYAIIFQRHLLA
jgi:hypothetical protein